MPFTPAHPALVLPFIRSRFVSATGLIVGSLAPDFEYFLKMQEGKVHSHTIAGMFYFDFPLSIVIALLFHGIVKQALIANLPLWFQKRFRDTLMFDFIKYGKSHPLIFSGSVLAGCASHLLWDSFTHADGYFVNIIPVYESTVVPFDGVRYPLWYALQHFSSYIGLAIVIFFILIKKAVPVNHIFRPSVFYWILMVGITAFVIWIRFLVKPDVTLGNVVVSSISGLCIALIVCGIAMAPKRIINRPKVPM